MTADGTEYDSAKMAYYDTGVLDLYDQTLLTDSSYNVFLDPYAYAIGVELYEGQLNYVFITGYDRTGSNIFNNTATAAGIFLDGTMDTIDVNVTNTNRNIEDRADDTKVDTDYDAKYDLWTGNGFYAVNRWFSYTENNGVYTLRPVDEDNMLVTNYNLTGDQTETINCSNVWVSDNADPRNNPSDPDKNLTTSGRRGFGNDDSVYITVEPGTVVNTGNNEAAITDVTGVYTGVQNVDIQLEAGYRKAVPHDIYTLVNDDQYIIASIVLGEAQGAVANYAYVLDAPTSERIDRTTGTYYWTFDSIIGGKFVELEGRSTYQDAMTLLENREGYVVELRFDADDYVVDAKSVTPDVTKVEEQIVDGDEVYDVTYGAAANNGTYYDLYLTGRTLHSGDPSNGLTFVSDAPAVLYQEINGDWVRCEYSKSRPALPASCT